MLRRSARCTTPASPGRTSATSSSAASAPTGQSSTRGARPVGGGTWWTATRPSSSTMCSRITPWSRLRTMIISSPMIMIMIPPPPHLRPSRLTFRTPFFLPFLRGSSMKIFSTTSSSFLCQATPTSSTRPRSAPRPQARASDPGPDPGPGPGPRLGPGKDRGRETETGPESRTTLHRGHGTTMVDRGQEIATAVSRGLETEEINSGLATILKKGMPINRGTEAIMKGE